MAESIDNSKKFINVTQLERLAKALDDRHNDDFGSLLNVIESLDETKGDKNDIDRVEAMLGGKSLRYLTQEEYDALSDEEKQDETIVYCIIDKDMSDGITEEDLFKILPCYDTRENEVKEYTYDGIAGDRETFVSLVKISNDVYTLEDMKTFYDFVIEITSGDKLIENLTLPYLPENESIFLVDDKILFLEVLAVVFEDCEIDGLLFTRGVWFLSEENAYVSRFKFVIPGEGEFKQLDKKFMTIKPGENVEGQVMIVRTESDEITEIIAKVGAEIFNTSGGNVAIGSFSHAEGYATQAIGELSHSEGLYTTVTGDYSHAEGYGTYADGEASHAEGYMTRALGSISHSEGYNTEALGNFSHVEGQGTHAEGETSHAEGYETYAVGESSHVEGAFNSANGSCSHAEGSNSKADGEASHVEGFSNEAIGNYSHAEGSETKAEGIASHSEGDGTEARGDYSHAEGFMTIAMNDCQHVQGRLNIADEENKYAHIVGNGQEHTDDNVSFTYTYSNAHTLDWDGNAWFAGDVTIGADNKKLATEEYVNSKGANINIDTATSDNLNTEDKTLVGAINEIKEMIPCYDTRIGETKTYTFDGNTENKETIQGMLVKISDDTYTLEQLEQATDVYIEMSTTEGYTDSQTFENLDGHVQEMPTDNGEPVLMLLEGFIYIANTEVDLGGILVPPGMWAIATGGMYISKFEFYIGSEGEFKELDYKFIKTAMNAKPGLNVEGEENELRIPIDYDEDDFIETQSQPGAEIFNSYSGEYKNVAVGDYSHAEGFSTLAFGIGSHAEGGDNRAIGVGTHAEGFSTLAFGNYSHSEGSMTEAYGEGSHTEGHYSEARGDFSHAEGTGTSAFGEGSHAEGCDTIASSDYQHVQGKYNIEDAENKYAHIVGNGELSQRSNAHTLDWDGNAWFAGTITAEGAPTESNHLVCKEYVDDCVGRLLSETYYDDRYQVCYVYDFLGDFEGNEIVGNYVKITDDAHDLEKIENAYDFTINMKDTEANETLQLRLPNLLNNSLTTIEYLEGNKGLRVLPYIVFVFETVTDNGMTFEPGIWTMFKDSKSYISRLSFVCATSGDIKLIDKKFLVNSPGKFTEGETLYSNNKQEYIEAEYGAEIFNDYHNNIATGLFSHSEGFFTEANGSFSHAEGFNTVANGVSQHVQGQFNIKDTENKYAHIVGNGEDTHQRSNAHTLDWNGNAWFQGDVTIGADNKKLATEEYVDSKGVNIDTATSDNLSTTDKTIVGAINELELEMFEAKADIIALDEYKLEQEDLPCYDNRTTERRTYTYTYSASDTLIGGMGVKVSDDIYTMEDVEKFSNVRTISKYKNGAIHETHNYPLLLESDYSVIFIPDDSGDIIAAYIGGNEAIVVFKENEEGLSPGVYFTVYQDLYVSELSFDYALSGEIKILDEKYLVNKPGKLVYHTCPDCGEIEVGEIFNSCYNNAGNFSHAEGMNTKAMGEMAHSEGMNTSAGGLVSHAEGYYAEANGSFSHAEGYFTEAIGNVSHVEGHGTIANGDCQHVQGQYNIPDDDGVYAHIVGNGTSSVRSNAHTLDWGGNAWFAGKATVSVQPTANNDLTTKLYVDQSIAQANNGLQSQIDELFQNVSNGKTLIASAITDKGIEASGDETFSSLSDKINQIPVGPPGSNIIGYINENNDIYVSLTELESGTYTLKLEDYNGVLDDFHDIGTVEVE